MTSASESPSLTAAGPVRAVRVAFKEWAGVCRALADGRQTVILRKGGVAEGDGPGTFRPEHDAFWLYPTYVHQAEQGLRVPAPEPPPDLAERVPLDVLVVVDRLYHLDRADDLPAIEPFHVWTAETVARRFHYRAPGLWVLAVRASRRAEPWPLAVTADQVGCKTWVPLADPPTPGELTPALDDEAFARLGSALREALGRGRTA